MNEQKRRDVLKKGVQLHLRTCRHPLLKTCVKRIANGFNDMPCFSIIRSLDLPAHILKFSAMRPAVPEIRLRGAYERTCRCTTWLFFVKCIAKRSQTTHQISAHSSQPFPRYRKGVHTCSHTDVQCPAVEMVITMVRSIFRVLDVFLRIVE